MKGAGEEAGAVKTGLAPIAAADARLLILGSLPGDVSLSAKRYYAHPTNQFWRLVGGAIGEGLDGLDYGERLQRLGARRIALWDVIASAKRRGSLDTAIRSPAPNALDRLLATLPQLGAIAFNGATAAAIGRKALGQAAPRFRLIDLPSSSAAYTLPFAAKAERWAVLGEICG